MWISYLLTQEFGWETSNSLSFSFSNSFFPSFGILPCKFDGEVNLHFVEWCPGFLKAESWDYEKFCTLVWLVRNDCCGDYFKRRHRTTFAFSSDRNFPALDFFPCNIEGKVSLCFCGEFPWNLELKSWILRN